MDLNRLKQTLRLRNGREQQQRQQNQQQQDRELQQRRQQQQQQQEQQRYQQQQEQQQAQQQQQQQDQRAPSHPQPAARPVTPPQGSATNGSYRQQIQQPVTLRTAADSRGGPALRNWDAASPRSVKINIRRFPARPSTSQTTSPIETNKPRPKQQANYVSPAQAALQQPLSFERTQAPASQQPTPAQKESNDSPELRQKQSILDFDLRPPAPEPISTVETLAEQLFSAGHLNVLLQNPQLLARLCAFLKKYKPDSYTQISQYLERQKAIKAIEYANAIAESIRAPYYRNGRLQATSTAIFAASVNKDFEEANEMAHQNLVNTALPAYITHKLVKIVSRCLVDEITGRETTSAVHNLIGGLSEIFCISDPGQPDNPIIYASEEFYRAFGYGRQDVMGQNCRLLQGSKTNKEVCSRLRKAIQNGEEVYETILNYRRNGRAFINLLMVAPLNDDAGKAKYHIGAQVDVTDLINDGKVLKSFEDFLANRKQQRQPMSKRINEDGVNSKALDKLRGLGEMFEPEESAIFGSKITSDSPVQDGSKLRTASQDSSQSDISDDEEDQPDTLRLSLPRGLGKPPGIYDSFMLVRPLPSSRIIFVSPSLQQWNGVRQTRFFSHIAAPAPTLRGLEDSFGEGIPVAAKVKFMPEGSEDFVGRDVGADENHEHDQSGRACWISATPLYGSDDKIGVWMVVFIEKPKDRSPQEAGGSKALMVKHELARSAVEDHFVADLSQNQQAQPGLAQLGVEDPPAGKADVAAVGDAKPSALIAHSPEPEQFPVQDGRTEDQSCSPETVQQSRGTEGAQDQRQSFISDGALLEAIPGSSKAPASKADVHDEFDRAQQPELAITTAALETPRKSNDRSEKSDQPSSPRTPKRTPTIDTLARNFEDVPSVPSSAEPHSQNERETNVDQSTTKPELSSAEQIRKDSGNFERLTESEKSDDVAGADVPLGATRRVATEGDNAVMSSSNLPTAPQVQDTAQAQAPLISNQTLDDQKDANAESAPMEPVVEQSTQLSTGGIEDTPIQRTNEVLPRRTSVKYGRSGIQIEKQEEAQKPVSSLVQQEPAAVEDKSASLETETPAAEMAESALQEISVVPDNTEHTTVMPRRESVKYGRSGIELLDARSNKRTPTESSRDTQSPSRAIPETAQQIPGPDLNLDRSHADDVTTTQEIRPEQHAESMQRRQSVKYGRSGIELLDTGKQTAPLKEPVKDTVPDTESVSIPTAQESLFNANLVESRHIAEQNLEQNQQSSQTEPIPRRQSIKYGRSGIELLDTRNKLDTEQPTREAQPRAEPAAATEQPLPSGTDITQIGQDMVVNSDPESQPQRPETMARKDSIKYGRSGIELLDSNTPKPASTEPHSTESVSSERAPKDPSLTEVSSDQQQSPQSEPISRRQSMKYGRSGPEILRLGSQKSSRTDPAIAESTPAAGISTSSVDPQAGTAIQNTEEKPLMSAAALLPAEESSKPDVQPVETTDNNTKAMQQIQQSKTPSMIPRRQSTKYGRSGPELPVLKEQEHAESTSDIPDQNREVSEEQQPEVEIVPRVFGRSGPSYHSSISRRKSNSAKTVSDAEPESPVHSDVTQQQQPQEQLQVSSQDNVPSLSEASGQVPTESAAEQDQLLPVPPVMSRRQSTKYGRSGPELPRIKESQTSLPAEDSSMGPTISPPLDADATTPAMQRKESVKYGRSGPELLSFRDRRSSQPSEKLPAGVDTGITAQQPAEGPVQSNDLEHKVEEPVPMPVTTNEVVPDEASPVQDAPAMPRRSSVKYGRSGPEFTRLTDQRVTVEAKQPDSDDTKLAPPAQPQTEGSLELPRRSSIKYGKSGPELLSMKLARTLSQSKLSDDSVEESRNDLARRDNVHEQVVPTESVTENHQPEETRILQSKQVPRQEADEPRLSEDKESVAPDAVTTASIPQPESTIESTPRRSSVKYGRSGPELESLRYRQPSKTDKPVQDITTSETTVSDKQPSLARSDDSQVPIEQPQPTLAAIPRRQSVKYGRSGPEFERTTSERASESAAPIDSTAATEPSRDDQQHSSERNEELETPIQQPQIATDAVPRRQSVKYGRSGPELENPKIRQAKLPETVADDTAREASTLEKDQTSKAPIEASDSKVQEPQITAEAIPRRLSVKYGRSGPELESVKSRQANNPDKTPKVQTPTVQASSAGTSEVTEHNETELSSPVLPSKAETTRRRPSVKYGRSGPELETLKAREASILDATTENQQLAERSVSGTPVAASEEQSAISPPPMPKPLESVPRRQSIKYGRSGPELARVEAEKVQKATENVEPVTSLKPPFVAAPAEQVTDEKPQEAVVKVKDFATPLPTSLSQGESSQQEDIPPSRRHSVKFGRSGPEIVGYKAKKPDYTTIPDHPEEPVADSATRTTEADSAGVKDVTNQADTFAAEKPTLGEAVAIPRRQSVKFGRSGPELLRTPREKSETQNIPEVPAEQPSLTPSTTVPPQESDLPVSNIASTQSEATSSKDDAPAVLRRESVKYGRSGPELVRSRNEKAEEPIVATVSAGSPVPHKSDNIVTDVEPAQAFSKNEVSPMEGMPSHSETQQLPRRQSIKYGRSGPEILRSVPDRSEKAIESGTPVEASARGPKSEASPSIATADLASDPGDSKPSQIDAEAMPRRQSIKFGRSGPELSRTKSNKPEKLAITEDPSESKIPASTDRDLAVEQPNNATASESIRRTEAVDSRDEVPPRRMSVKYGRSGPELDSLKSNQLGQTTQRNVAEPMVAPSLPISQLPEPYSPLLQETGVVDNEVPSDLRPTQDEASTMPRQQSVRYGRSGPEIIRSKTSETRRSTQDSERDAVADSGELPAVVATNEDSLTSALPTEVYATQPSDEQNPSNVKDIPTTSESGSGPSDPSLEAVPRRASVKYGRSGPVLVSFKRSRQEVARDDKVAETSSPHQDVLTRVTPSETLTADPRAVSPEKDITTSRQGSGDSNFKYTTPRVKGVSKFRESFDETGSVSTSTENPEAIKFTQPDFLTTGTPQVSNSDMQSAASIPDKKQDIARQMTPSSMPRRSSVKYGNSGIEVLRSQSTPLQESVEAPESEFKGKEIDTNLREQDLVAESSQATKSVEPSQPQALGPGQPEASGDQMTGQSEARPKTISLDDSQSEPAFNGRRSSVKYGKSGIDLLPSRRKWKDQLERPTSPASPTTAASETFVPTEHQVSQVETVQPAQSEVTAPEQVVPGSAVSGLSMLDPTIAESATSKTMLSDQAKLEPSAPEPSKGQSNVRSNVSNVGEVQALPRRESIKYGKSGIDLLPSRRKQKEGAQQPASHSNEVSDPVSSNLDDNQTAQSNAENPSEQPVASMQGGNVEESSPMMPRRLSVKYGRSGIELGALKNQQSEQPIASSAIKNTTASDTADTQARIPQAATEPASVPSEAMPSDEPVATSSNFEALPRRPSVKYGRSGIELAGRKDSASRRKVENKFDENLAEGSTQRNNEPRQSITEVDQSLLPEAYAAMQAERTLSANADEWDQQTRGLPKESFQGTQDLSRRQSTKYGRSGIQLESPSPKRKAEELLRSPSSEDVASKKPATNAYNQQVFTSSMSAETESEAPVRRPSVKYGRSGLELLNSKTPKKVDEPFEPAKEESVPADLAMATSVPLPQTGMKDHADSIAQRTQLDDDSRSSAKTAAVAPMPADVVVRRPSVKYGRSGPELATLQSRSKPAASIESKEADLGQKEDSAKRDQEEPLTQPTMPSNEALIASADFRFPQPNTPTAIARVTEKSDGATSSVNNLMPRRMSRKFGRSGIDFGQSPEKQLEETQNTTELSREAGNLPREADTLNQHDDTTSGMQATVAEAGQKLSEGEQTFSHRDVPTDPASSTSSTKELDEYLASENPIPPVLPETMVTPASPKVQPEEAASLDAADEAKDVFSENESAASRTGQSSLVAEAAQDSKGGNERLAVQKPVNRLMSGVVASRTSSIYSQDLAEEEEAEHHQTVGGSQHKPPSHFTKLEQDPQAVEEEDVRPPVMEYAPSARTTAEAGTPVPSDSPNDKLVSSDVEEQVVPDTEPTPIIASADEKSTAGDTTDQTTVASTIEGADHDSEIRPGMDNNLHEAKAVAETETPPAGSHEQHGDPVEPEKDSDDREKNDTAHGPEDPTSSTTRSEETQPQVTQNEQQEASRDDGKAAHVHDAGAHMIDPDSSEIQESSTTKEQALPAAAGCQNATQASRELNATGSDIESSAVHAPTGPTVQSIEAELQPRTEAGHDLSEAEPGTDTAVSREQPEAASVAEAEAAESKTAAQSNDDAPDKQDLPQWASQASRTLDEPSDENIMTTTEEKQQAGSFRSAPSRSSALSRNLGMGTAPTYLYQSSAQPSEGRPRDDQPASDPGLLSRMGGGLMALATKIAKPESGSKKDSQSAGNVDLETEEDTPNVTAENEAARHVQNQDEELPQSTSIPTSKTDRVELEDDQASTQEIETDVQNDTLFPVDTNEVKSVSGKVSGENDSKLSDEATMKILEKPNNIPGAFKEEKAAKQEQDEMIAETGPVRGAPLSEETQGVNMPSDTTSRGSVIEDGLSSQASSKEAETIEHDQVLSQTHPVRQETVLAEDKDSSLPAAVTESGTTDSSIQAQQPVDDPTEHIGQPQDESEAPAEPEQIGTSSNVTSQAVASDDQVRTDTQANEEEQDQSLTSTQPVREETMHDELVETSKPSRDLDPNISSASQEGSSASDSNVDKQQEDPYASANLSRAENTTDEISEQPIISADTEDRAPVSNIHEYEHQVEAASVREDERNEHLVDDHSMEEEKDQGESYTELSDKGDAEIPHVATKSTSLSTHVQPNAQTSDIRSLEQTETDLEEQDQDQNLTNSQPVRKETMDDEVDNMTEPSTGVSTQAIVSGDQKQAEADQSAETGEQDQNLENSQSVREQPLQVEEGEDARASKVDEQVKDMIEESNEPDTSRNSLKPVGEESRSDTLPSEHDTSPTSHPRAGKQAGVATSSSSISDDQGSQKEIDDAEKLESDGKLEESQALRRQTMLDEGKEDLPSVETSGMGKESIDTSEDQERSENVTDIKQKEQSATTTALNVKSTQADQHKASTATETVDAAATEPDQHQQQNDEPTQEKQQEEQLEESAPLRQETMLEDTQEQRTPSLLHEPKTDVIDSQSEVEASKATTIEDQEVQQAPEEEASQEQTVHDDDTQAFETAEATDVSAAEVTEADNTPKQLEHDQHLPEGEILRQEQMHDDDEEGSTTSEQQETKSTTAEGQSDQDAVNVTRPTEQDLDLPRSPSLQEESALKGEESQYVYSNSTRSRGAAGDAVISSLVGADHAKSTAEKDAAANQFGWQEQSHKTASEDNDPSSSQAALMSQDEASYTGPHAVEDKEESNNADDNDPKASEAETQDRNLAGVDNDFNETTKTSDDSQSVDADDDRPTTPEPEVKAKAQDKDFISSGHNSQDSTRSSDETKAADVDEDVSMESEAKVQSQDPAGVDNDFQESTETLEEGKQDRGKHFESTATPRAGFINKAMSIVFNTASRSNSAANSPADGKSQSNRGSKTRASTNGSESDEPGDQPFWVSVLAGDQSESSPSQKESSPSQKESSPPQTSEAQESTVEKRGAEEAILLGATKPERTFSDLGDSIGAAYESIMESPKLSAEDKRGKDDAPIKATENKEYEEAVDDYSDDEYVVVSPKTPDRIPPKRTRVHIQPDTDDESGANESDPFTGKRSSSAGEEIPEQERKYTPPPEIPSSSMRQTPRPRTPSPTSSEVDTETPTRSNFHVEETEIRRMLGSGTMAAARPQLRPTTSSYMDYISRGGSRPMSSSYHQGAGAPAVGGLPLRDPMVSQEDATETKTDSSHFAETDCSRSPYSVD